MDLTRYLGRLAPATAEAAYDRLTAYGFARRYVAGKTVADVSFEHAGYGSHLLAETAESVVVLTNSAEVAEMASSAYPAPNASYEKANLPTLPYPEDRFDVVVAFRVLENLQRPEDLVKEAKRVLKPDGMLIVSVPDEQRALADDQRGMYVPELRQLLRRHFEHALMYRQGAVAGGFVLPVSGKASDELVESAPLSLSTPNTDAEPPAARSVIAVCGDEEGIGQEEAYLLLDRDRRIFDECADRAEDVDLLRDEIRRMQETEVQAFQDSYKLHRTEIAYLRARIRHAETQTRRSETQTRHAEARVRDLRNRINDMENSTIWRLSEPYRRVRARIDAMTKRTPKGTEKDSDDTPG